MIARKHRFLCLFFLHALSRLRLMRPETKNKSRLSVAAPVEIGSTQNYVHEFSE